MIHGGREVINKDYEQKWTKKYFLRDARDKRERVRNATIKEDVLRTTGEKGLDPHP